jgi:hypothetical protein
MAWIKHWGGWVAGALVGLYLAIREWMTTRPPELADLKKKVEAETAEADKKAAELAVAEKDEATRAHEQGMVTELAKETAITTRIEKAPKQVDDYLHDAGDEARRK